MLARQMDAVSLCKYCGDDRPLVNAHVIPAAFFRDAKSRKGAPLYMLPNDAGRHPKRAPVGPYDPAILCAKCEPRFQDFDDYAARVLIRDRNKVFRQEGGVFIADGLDYTRLKLFIVSVLWRASVSTLEYYRRIDLGPRLARARQMLDDQDPGSAAEFGTMLVRWLPTPGKALVPKLSASPYTQRIDGVVTVRLFLGEFMAFVCTGRRLLAPGYADVVIAPGGPVYALGKPLAESKDLLAFHDALLHHGARLAKRGS